MLAFYTGSSVDYDLYIFCSLITGDVVYSCGSVLVFSCTCSDIGKVFFGVTMYYVGSNFPVGSNLVYVGDNLIYVGSNLVYVGDNLIHVCSNLTYVCSNLLYVDSNLFYVGSSFFEVKL